MSKILARARDRFEATPRALDDDELVRISRGDRGCLGDALSGFGAIAMIAAMIASALGMIAFAWAYVGVAIWIGGFVWGTIAQSRSGKQRKGALESGPLVLSVVLRDDDWLRRPGKRVGRVVVLFATDDPHRFDRAWLEAAAKRLAHQLDAAAGNQAWTPIRALLADREIFGIHRVPADLLGSDADATVYLAALNVHPERLDGDYLGYEDDLDSDGRDDDLDGVRRAPTVLLIVDPERGFLEQVPRPTAKPPAAKPPVEPAEPAEPTAE